MIRDAFGRFMSSKSKTDNFVPIQELIGQIGIILQFKSNQIKETHEVDGVKLDYKIPSHTLPDNKVFVVSVTQYTRDTICVNYYKTLDIEYETYVICHKNEMVCLVDDDKLNADFQRRIFSNMISFLRHNFYIGCDPEIFVEDENGIVIPAFNFLRSKKDQPTHYWDGFQAEFTTHASSCLGHQANYVQDGLYKIWRDARAHNPKAKLSIKTVMDIPNEMLKTAKDEHVQFGCMPSLNVYGMHGEVSDGRITPFRPVGGHMHFGVGKSLTPKQTDDIIKALDAILGVACVSLFAAFDDPRRRRLYGLAGEYRLPPHGIEYRTLSNAWLFHPLLTNMCFDLARKAVMFGRNGFMKNWPIDQQRTIEVINSCDVGGARKILEENKEMFKGIIKACAGYYHMEDNAEYAFKVFLNGADSVINDPTNFANNWQFNGGWVTHGRQFSTYLQNLKDGKKIA